MFFWDEGLRKWNSVKVRSLSWGSWDTAFGQIDHLCHQQWLALLCLHGFSSLRSITLPLLFHGTPRALLPIELVCSCFTYSPAAQVHSETNRRFSIFFIFAFQTQEISKSSFWETTSRTSGSGWVAPAAPSSSSKSPTKGSACFCELCLGSCPKMMLFKAQWFAPSVDYLTRQIRPFGRTTNLTSA